MTIEAAIVIPLFLFFCLTILSVLSFLGVSSNITAALHQTGKEMAVKGYVSSGGELSLAYARGQIRAQLNQEGTENLLIAGGNNGLSFEYSKVMEQDMIDLVVVYTVKPMISFFGFSGGKLVNRCRMRAWTGYDNTQAITGEGGEQIVYITKTGTVYHISKGCTHLSLSIQSVYPKEIGKLRSKDGSKYYACEVCSGIDMGIYYITAQGNRYHVDVECSGLKRTVSAIPISEAGNRSPCSRCGM